jgi:glycerol kinase
MPYVLALDQSTSATKALLFDREGCALDRESRDHRQFYPQPGWVEHDAEEIWQNALYVLRAVVARHPEKLTDLVCLSLTNQRETVLIFDRASGQPLHPALVWQCRRGTSLCAELTAQGHAPGVHARTGLPIDPYFSASKLCHLLRQEPVLRQRLREGTALIGTIDAYLIYRLTAGQVFACDTTNASRTLLFDLNRLDWDQDLCDLWDVPCHALPEPRASDASFGTTTLEGFLPRALPIRGVMGDSQAALFAHRSFSPGSVKVTLGTGSSILLNIGDTPRFPSPRIPTTLAWQLGRQPTYALEGIIISAGSTLTWLRDQMSFVAHVAEIDALAASVADNGGVYLVPAFTGLGLPYWNSSARAALCGLTPHSDRRHVARAALESIAFQLRDALDALRAEAGVALQDIRVDGGPSASAVLMQITANLTGARLCVPKMAHCSPLGATFAGLLGSGEFGSIADLSRLQQDEAVYTPQMPPPNVAAFLQDWHRAVKQVSG